MENQESIERSLGRVEGKLDSLIVTVTHLSNSFQQLESGRVSALESGYATLKAESTSQAKNTAMWVSAFISIGITVIGSFLIKHFGL